MRGAAVRVHSNGCNTIQPQEDQIHEVFLGEGFFLQMGMNQTQAPQTPAPPTAFGQVRNEERAGTADQNGFDRSIAGQEEPDLAAAFEGKARQIAR